MMFKSQSDEDKSDANGLALDVEYVPRICEVRNSWFVPGCACPVRASYSIFSSSRRGPKRHQNLLLCRRRPQSPFFPSTLTSASQPSIYNIRRRMSDRPVPVPPPPGRIQVDQSLASSVESSSSSAWDRIMTWAAEHKAVVYTIAGVTVIATAAGVYYYTGSGQRAEGSAASKKKAKKDRRKAKKEAEEAEKRLAGETGERATAGRRTRSFLTECPSRVQEGFCRNRRRASPDY